MTPLLGGGYPRERGAHWPEPRECEKCRMPTAYVVGGWNFCVSSKCDRRGKSFSALDRWFLEAAKLSLETKP